MQLGLREFLQLRSAEKSADGTTVITATTGGVHIPIAFLSGIALRSLQERLAVVPRATYDKTVVPEAIDCFQLTSTHIIVPRSFGYACYKETIKEKYAESTRFQADLLFAGRLEDLQKEVCEKALKRLESKPYATIVTLPCGYGKTVIALNVAYALGHRTLVVVHKEFLLNQWKERITKFLPGASIGIIQGSKASQPGHDIYLGMLQTLCNRLKDTDHAITKIVETCGFAIIDEAHHMAARSFSELFFVLPCKHILGLTATPKRKDGTQNMLHMFMGDFAYKLEDSQTKESIMVRYCHFASPAKVTRILTPAAVQKQKTILTKNVKRNKMLVALCGEYIVQNRQILCLSERLAHLNALKEIFDKMYPSYISALYVGGQNKQDRERAEQEACMIFGTFAMAQEGLDVPRLDTMILASPASDIRQALGRILRPCKTKQSPLVIDIQDDECNQFERMNLQRRHYYDTLQCRNEAKPQVAEELTMFSPPKTNKRKREES